MSNHPAVIRLGTRGSALARWQTDHVCSLLQAAWPDLTLEVNVITTRGDQILDTPLPLVGGKGVFTAELEAALHNGAIDLAVHSLKDLPTESPQGLTIGAVPQRANPHDVLISRDGYMLDTLPDGATVGTSSTRRIAQLRHHRPDVRIADLRGNIDTRIRKALDPNGPYDAIILARAGLERLEKPEVITQVLPFDLFLPAPGQGALAIQCRDEQTILELLRPLTHFRTQAAVAAERTFLAGLGGGCAVPIAAHAHFTEQGQFHLQARVCSIDGTAQIDVSDLSPVEESRLDLGEAVRLGAELARTAIAQGAGTIIGLAGRDSHKP